MKAMIIGAGVGGMASAIRLKRLGLEVSVFERREIPGGRLSNFQEKGFRIDRGPTLLLMPSVMREFFSDVGRDIEQYLNLKQLDPVYRLYFNDGSIIEPSAFPERMESNISKVNPDDAKKYAKFIEDYEKYYDIAMKEFIMKNFDSPLDMVNPAGIFSLLSGGAFKDLYSKTGEYFSDIRVRMAFSLQAIYLGERPDIIPSVYGIVPYIEFTEGVWYPEGGMYSIADSLAKICREEEVPIKMGSNAKRIIIEDGSARGVEFEDGTTEMADIVISNADLPYTYMKLIPPEQRPHMSDSKLKSLATSCSTFMLYLGVDGHYNTEHHNFILPLEYKELLDDVFKDQVLPDTPGVYVANPSSHDPTLAPKGKSVIYVLVPVPNLSGKVDWKKKKKAFREKILDSLSSIGMDDIRQRIVYERMITPDDWKEEFNLEKGATFGLSPILWQSAAFRPPNRDPKIKNLYFVGASTHPGGGLPIVLMSSKLLEMRIRKDYGV